MKNQKRKNKTIFQNLFHMCSLRNLENEYFDRKLNIYIRKLYTKSVYICLWIISEF